MKLASVKKGGLGRRAWPRDLPQRMVEDECALSEVEALAEINATFLRLLDATLRGVGIEKTAAFYRISPEALGQVPPVVGQVDLLASIVSEPFSFVTLRRDVRAGGRKSGPILQEGKRDAHLGERRRSLQLTLQAMVVVFVRTVSDPGIVDAVLGLARSQVAQREALAASWHRWLLTDQPWLVAAPACELRLLATRWRREDRVRVLSRIITADDDVG